jgi:hypothetical protein
MTKKRTWPIVPVVLLAIAFTPACGGKPVAMNDIPVFPGAVELTAGTSSIADTLRQNEATDAAMRQAIQAGGKVEQRAWQLPGGKAWPEVKAFFEEQLPTSGWQSGMGGAGGGFVDVNKMMETVNQANPVSQTMIFSRGKQTLTLLVLALPGSQDGKQLIVSLATN